jgi:hypothetical protein
MLDSAAKSVAPAGVVCVDRALAGATAATGGRWTAKAGGWARSGALSKARSEVTVNAWGVLAGAGIAVRARVGPAGESATFEALSHAGIAGAAGAAADGLTAAWLVSAVAGAGVPAAAAGPPESTAAEEALRLDAPARVAAAERDVLLRGVAPF